MSVVVKFEENTDEIKTGNEHKSDLKKWWTGYVINDHALDEETGAESQNNVF
jgi:hypothetical protein